MSSVLDKIVSDRARYSCDVKTLGECKLPSPVRHRKYVADGERVFATENETFARFAETKLGHLPTFEKAGPKERIFHDPRWTRVGIVTAGGLCPGLNTVIKGLVEILKFDYGVTNVFGIRYGYAGLNPKCGHEPLMLDADTVDTIHEAGGTILGSSRGQQPSDVMVDTLVRMNINVLFCIGGDGSLRCASDIAAEVARRGLKISVVGIPKTVDNDLMFVGRSFGFESAVAQAAEVIRNAHVEAKGTPHGIGLVKLMGRDSGFIAAAATIANPVVNFCLVPEVKFELGGPSGLLAALERRFAAGKSHAVIVVAEGAGQELLEGAEERDASGNVLKKDIGEFLKRKITDHFKGKGLDSSVKYIDPSYMVRSCPARGTDAIRCYELARAAVHAAMAGRTDCVVGSVGDSCSLVPIALATIERQKLDTDSQAWRSVLDATGQEFYFNGVARDTFAGDAFAP
ncbi:MAG: ATP-dependent 6-phosphofructokinase [Kiritimatiellae bacterium]|jgi:6-phosphofructokinase 1|nr:ATP-dependent 6-phosphofructokinase [Kiritimatiellia bacterium]